MFKKTMIMAMINMILHTSSVLGGLVSPGTMPGRIEQSPLAWVRGHWYNEPALEIKMIIKWKVTNVETFCV